jgi:cob(I)alamin adenosyltransferase
MTTLLNGQRVSKNDLLIHFIGTTDELNSHLGLVKALLDSGDTRRFIEEIQKNLMKLMSHVSDSKNEIYIFTGEEPAGLEKETERLKAMLPALTQFVIPGRDAVDAQIHIARTVARRAERLFAAVIEKQSFSPNAGVFLNKLSDYLFVLTQLPRN